MYDLLYSKEAMESIDALPLKKKRQIKSAVERIASNPECGKRLSHLLAGFYSYRSGDYRIIYKVFREKVTVYVAAVGNRKDVYEKFSKKAASIRNISLNESKRKYGRKGKS
jgi:mRNA interferase RelE/StbE